jgi:hypothetical protein
MHTTTKRWRKWQRRKRLLLVRRARRRIAKLLSRLPLLTEEQAEKHNRLVRFVNYLVAFPSEEGMPMIDGTAICPECGKEVWLIAEPDAWTERPQPGWRRRRSNPKVAWKVDGWGPGIGECCDGFIASQLDGDCHYYKRGV